MWRNGPAFTCTEIYVPPAKLKWSASLGTEECAVCFSMFIFKCLVLAPFICFLKGKESVSLQAWFVHPFAWLVCAPFCLIGLCFLLPKNLSGSFGLCSLSNNKLFWVTLFFGPFSLIIVPDSFYLFSVFLNKLFLLPSVVIPFNNIK
jgi:hypothetical protein